MCCRIPSAFSFWYETMWQIKECWKHELFERWKLSTHLMQSAIIYYHKSCEKRIPPQTRKRCKSTGMRHSYRANSNAMRWKSNGEKTLNSLANVTNVIYTFGVYCKDDGCCWTILKTRSKAHQLKIVRRQTNEPTNKKRNERNGK